MQYPLEVGSAFAVVFMNTLMAKLCGAQANDIRTVAEAKGIPTKEDTAYSFRTAKVMENFLQSQNRPTSWVTSPATPTTNSAA